MSKPSPFEIEMIQKFARAEVKLEGLRRKHPDSCPAADPVMEGVCRCGADEQNAKLDAAIAELKIN